MKIIKGTSTVMKCPYKECEACKKDVLIINNKTIDENKFIELRKIKNGEFGLENIKFFNCDLRIIDFSKIAWIHNSTIENCILNNSIHDLLKRMKKEQRQLKFNKLINFFKGK